MEETPAHTPGEEPGRDALPGAEPMPADGDADATQSEATEELRQKAAKGMVAVGLRSVIVRALGLASNLVIAPLLGPSAFGIVALGLSITVVGRFFSDGGLNAGFLGREEPPSRRELHALAGFQLLVTAGLTAIVACSIPIIGGDTFAITLMVASLIISVMRVPTVIVCERELDYRLIVRADIAESLVYTVLVISLVAAGFGIMGVAVATLLKSTIGTALLLFGGPLGWIRPSFHLGPLKSTARFGAFFQLSWLMTIARDEGLGLIIFLISGPAALGAWSLARRMLILLTVFFETAWRVALPGFSRLMQAGEDPKRLLQQGFSFAATGTGLPVAIIIGTCPALVPALFGDQWEDTVQVIPWIAGGLLIAVPIGTVLTSMLWAQQESVKVVQIGVPALVIILAAGAIGTALYGAEGAGMGYFLGQSVWFFSCVFTARHLFSARSLWGGAAPTLASFIAASVAYTEAKSIDDLWLAAGTSAALATAVYLVAVAILDFPALRRMGRLFQRVAPG